MKGLFIPGITAEMFRNGCLESIEELMTEGEIYDIEHSPWIPVSERLLEKGYSVLITRITDDNCKYTRIASYQGDCWMDNTDEFNKPNPHKVIAWQPLPEPYKAESEE